MSETKQLLDEYAAEAAAMRANMREMAIALVLVTAHLGSGNRHVARVPAAARRMANRITHVSIEWSNPERFTEVGSMRLIPTFAPTEVKE